MLHYHSHHLPRDQNNTHDTLPMKFQTSSLCDTDYSHTIMLLIYIFSTVTSASYTALILFLNQTLILKLLSGGFEMERLFRFNMEDMILIETLLSHCVYLCLFTFELRLNHCSFDDTRFCWFAHIRSYLRSLFQYYYFRTIRMKQKKPILVQSQS